MRPIANDDEARLEQINLNFDIMMEELDALMES
jgi:hypothetical protein